MTVESVNYISDLDPTNPKGSDAIAEGDNHIRNVKDSLIKTFPEVKGEVTATHEELSQLSGLSDPVAPALPEEPSEEGSMLTNVGSKWSETVVLKIANDKAVIPAFAGMGNLNLYVNNEGEVIASELDTDPTLIHDLQFHSDVEFDGDPERDDVLVFDGTKWKSKKILGGGMVPAIKQPSTAGDFSLTGHGKWTASGTSVKLTVPSDMKFGLLYLHLEPPEGGFTELSPANILIDGQQYYGPESGELKQSTATEYIKHYFPFFGPESGPLIEVKNTIEINNIEGTSPVHTVAVIGVFIEDV